MTKTKKIITVIGIICVCCLLLAAPFICAEIRYQTDINETAKKYKDAGYYYYGFTFQVINNTYGLNVMLNDLPSDKDDALERITSIIENGLLDDIITMPEFTRHGYCPVNILVHLPDTRHPFSWIPNGGEEDEIAASKLKTMSVSIKPNIDKTFDITYVYYYDKFDAR